jgi:hypothetical protein
MSTLVVTLKGQVTLSKDILKHLVSDLARRLS